MDKMKLNLISFTFVVGSIFLGCTSDYSRNLGNGYVFCDEGEDFKFIYHKHSIGGEIPPTVLSYKFNNEFIVVKQLPRLTNNQDTIWYYIVIKNENKIYGPFCFDEYVDQIKKYGINLMVEDW